VVAEEFDASGGDGDEEGRGVEGLEERGACGLEEGVELSHALISG
jgi:hypothetical protein